MRTDGLRMVAMAVVSGCAVWSAKMTLHAGRGNRSAVLVAMFVVWVLMPFVTMVWVNFVSGLWPAGMRVGLYVVSMVIAAVSVAVYARVVAHPPRQMALPFLAVPVVSFVVLGAVMGGGRALGRR